MGHPAAVMPPLRHHAASSRHAACHSPLTTDHSSPLHTAYTLLLTLPPSPPCFITPLTLHRRASPLFHYYYVIFYSIAYMPHCQRWFSVHYQAINLHLVMCVSYLASRPPFLLSFFPPLSDFNFLDFYFYLLRVRPISAFSSCLSSTTLL